MPDKSQSHPFREKNIKEWTANDYADFWYYETGVNVIPYNGVEKYTWVKWKNHQKGNFQTEPLPLDVFNAWKKADSFSKGISVVCSKVFRGEHAGKWLNGIDMTIQYEQKTGKRKRACRVCSRHTN